MPQEWAQEVQQEAGQGGQQGDGPCDWHQAAGQNDGQVSF